MNIWFKRGELKLKNSRFFATRSAARQVFYPGCALVGADPDFCLRLYRTLLQQNSALGIWFDCCAKPLRLKQDHAVAAQAEQTLVQSMLEAGVEEVITACGNCHEQFSGFASDKLKITMIYELLDDLSLAAGSPGWTIHHPCFARVNPALQTAVFRLADQQGFLIKNRHQQSHPLSCCLHQTEKARERRLALGQEKLLTYCAHCVMSFQRDLPTRHLLQELLGSSKFWSQPGKIGLFVNYRRFCKRVQNMLSSSG